MRRLAIAIAAGLLLASVAGPVSAAKPATRGFLPANAQPGGYSLVDLGTAWNAWAFSPPAATSPFLDVRCEQSRIDPKIWFLPEAYPGGPTTATCAVPQGAFLVVSPFFIEWSQAELGYPATEAQLRASVDEWFSLLTSITVTLDGRPATHLAAYVATTRLDTLPADNLFGPDPTKTMNKGFFMVMAPLSRGTHTLGASWEIGSMALQAALTVTITVR